MTGLIQPICYPQPYGDESPVGYLIRVCQANKFNNIRWLYPEEGTLFSLKPTEILEQLLNSPWSGFENIKDGILPYCSLGSIDLNTTVLRYCPLCLEEEPYFRVQWHLKCTTVCVKHRCWLVDRCFECKDSLKYGRLVSVTDCHCSYSLSDTPISEIPINVIRFQQFIDGADTYFEGGNYWLSDSLNPSDFNLRRRIQLVHGFSQWQPVEDNSLTRAGAFSGFSDIETAKAYVLSAADVFFSDEDGFTPFLYHLHQQVYEKQDDGDKLFKRFYKYFFRQVGVSIEPLYHAVENYVNHNWQYYLTQKNSLFTESMIEGHRWLPLQTATNRFDISKSELKRAIAKKSVKSKENYHFDTNRTHTLVYQPDVLKYLHINESHVNGVTAASILGVTKKQFYQLLDSNYIEGEAPSKKSGVSWRIERSSLQSLLEKFTKILPVQDDQYLSLPDAIRKIGNRIESPFIRLLQAIEYGDISTVVNPQLVGLRSLCLSEAELMDWYSAQTIEDRLYTVRQLAEEMQILPDLIYSLMDIGALSSCYIPDLLGKRITKRSVQQFKERYVILSKLAKCSGVSKQRMKLIIESHGLQAIDEEAAADDKFCNRIYYRHEMLTKKDLAPLVSSMKDWEYMG